MHWVRVTRPRYEQSERYRGQVGEVVGRWGPENAASSTEGWLVEFPDDAIPHTELPKWEEAFTSC
jgi:hypothetical protein